MSKEKIWLLVFIILFVFGCNIGDSSERKKGANVENINNKELLTELREANTIETNYSSPVMAVFSFQPEASNQILESFPHYTIKLKDIDNWGIKEAVIAHIPDSIPIMITVESWGGKLKSSHRNNPLEDLVSGKFDHIIKQLCTKLIGMRPNVYFRFNPEMEVPANRYPWQRKGSYIEAFRHFSALCKNYAPQVKQVWGPAGYPGAMEWYPGDDFVDAVSITLTSDSEIPLDIYPKNYPVEYDLMRRLHRFRFIDKPIFVIGSKQSANDSIDSLLVSSITRKIKQNSSTVYSTDNFMRPESKIRTNQKRKLEIGFYDPQTILIEEESVTVEHIFLDFDGVLNGTFLKSFNEIVDRGHNVIVTVEPVYMQSSEPDLEVLQHVTQGKYDYEISLLYSIILSTERLVYLRYAHEMEIPITRYAWQSQNPVDYIKSYRYFMTFMDSLPGTIKRVWGPAGDRGSIEWWPGNDVVDYISIAIYGLPDKNISDPNKQESFATIFNRKYWRMRFIDKTIFITEFGVIGSEKYKKNWLEAAAEVIRNNTVISGVNYFNMSDTPKAWGDIKPPDWSISKETFNQFIKTLQDE